MFGEPSGDMSDHHVSDTRNPAEWVECENGNDIRYKCPTKDSREKCEAVNNREECEDVIDDHDLTPGCVYIPKVSTWRKGGKLVDGGDSGDGDGYCEPRMKFNCEDESDMTDSDAEWYWENANKTYQSPKETYDSLGRQERSREALRRHQQLFGNQ
jgi:hypothetical protein